MLRQREMHHDPGDGWIIVEAADFLLERFVGNIGRQRNAIEKLAQRHSVDLRVVDRAEKEPRVERPRAHAGERGPREHLMQLDVDQRVAVDGASQEIAEAQRVRIKYRAQAQPTGGAPLHVLRRLLELLDRCQDALGLAEQRPAAWREGHPGRRTLE